MGLWPSTTEVGFAVVLLGQDGVLLLAWPGWTTGCCFRVSGARPRVIGLLEAWGDSAGLQGENKSVSQKLV